MEQTQEAPFAASATTTTTSSLPLPMGPNLVGDQRGERNDGGGGGGDVVAVRRAAAVSVDDGITLHVPLAPTIATTPHYDTAHSNNNTNNSASGEVPRALPATGIGHDHHTHAPIPSLTLSSPHPAADASTIPMVTPIRSRKSKLAGPTSGALQRAFDAFHQHDQDHDHLISRNELLAVLHDAGLDIDETDVHDILRLVDLEGTGDLDFEEFYSLYVGLEIFNRLKKDTRSVMKKRELKQLLRMYGLDTDEKKLHKMMKLVGVEAGGIVHFDDFLRIYVKVHHQHHKNVDLLEHAVRHWYSGSGHGTILAIENLSPVQDMIAGTCAGVSITLVGHPFDTVKVRIQTAEKGMFAGPIDATLKTIRGEGLRGLYKGMGSPLATIPVINAIVFASYGLAKSWFTDPENPNKPLTLLQLASAGAFAGIVNSVVVSPVELIKTRLQTQYDNPGSVKDAMRHLLESGRLAFSWGKTPVDGVSGMPLMLNSDGSPVQDRYKGPVDVMRRIYRKAGIFGLGRGMSATVYRETPAYVGQFVVYELLKRAMMAQEEKEGSADDLNPFQLMFAGGLAGISAWVVSYPMDLVKSQIQAAPDFLAAKPKYAKSRLLFDGGFFSCVRQNVAANGWASLWKGFTPCVARAFPANAAGFLTYELAAKMLREKQQQANN
eukprot:TRINITY_DN5027_c0_g1_i1.p1 TRINITY_DN5027_c0_g1~~TRINITY_DN5027_c0_g1_i1.p1  ORF type:complete len:662 (+),score=109.99 TRINITY_DN5027_c0_g1_i1:80-2065(+)